MANDKANRSKSEKIELAAQVGSIVLGTVVSAMQILRMLRGEPQAEL
jgi:hypothetical protein